jgi:hypothetical protein
MVGFAGAQPTITCLRTRHAVRLAADAVTVERHLCIHSKYTRAISASGQKIMAKVLTAGVNVNQPRSMGSRSRPQVLVKFESGTGVSPLPARTGETPGPSEFKHYQYPAPDAQPPVADRFACGEAGKKLRCFSWNADHGRAPSTCCKCIARVGGGRARCERQTTHVMLSIGATVVGEKSVIGARCVAIALNTLAG